MTYVLAGTGSRSFQANGFVARQLDEHLMDIWYRHPDLEGMSGMAEGFDEFLAERFVALQIPWTAAVPNPGYGPHYWGNNSITGRPRMRDFNALLAKAKSVVYVCQQYYENGLHSNFHRNRYIAENGDEFVVGAPITEGTRHCFQAIKRAGKPYKIFGPWKESVTKSKNAL